MSRAADYASAALAGAISGLVPFWVINFGPYGPPKITVFNALYWVLLGALATVIMAPALWQSYYRLGGRSLVRAYHGRLAMARRGLWMIPAISALTFVVTFDWHATLIGAALLISTSMLVYPALHGWLHQRELPAVYVDQDEIVDPPDEEDTPGGCFCLVRQGANRAASRPDGFDNIELEAWRDDDRLKIYVVRPSAHLFERIQEGFGDWDNDGLIEAFRRAVSVTKFRRYSVEWTDSFPGQGGDYREPVMA